ncbi:transporter substrate-binding domain-containing protein [Candidatus Halobeggiatoa sp. HSG11]|nr:transporter substrate-binding domain-containing protein [Candidatus Halobeggiatoa sp. HSG11]
MKKTTLFTWLMTVSVVWILGVTSAFAKVDLADADQNIKYNSNQINNKQEFPAYLQRAAYDMDTGQLHIPAVDLFENGIRIGTLKVEMQKVPNSNAITPLFLLNETSVALKLETISYGSILQRVSERGKLLCGIQTGIENLRGFDIDLCYAVAAAVLGDKNAVQFEEIDADERDQALQSGKVDMLTAQTSWTGQRDAQWGDFTWIMLYDGQGFMVKPASNIHIFEHLKNKTICVTKGTTSETNLQHSFEMLGWDYTPKVYNSTIESYESYMENKCEVITSDKSTLAKLRIKSPEHSILEVTISKEPLAPIVPHGDGQWFDIIKIIMMGLINAEELGITKANIDKMKSFPNHNVKRLLGIIDSFGQSELGLKNDAIAKAIDAVGNYGEIYERNLGENGIKLPRGINNLWTRPNGMIYAPPL